MSNSSEISLASLQGSIQKERELREALKQLMDERDLRYTAEIKFREDLCQSKFDILTQAGISLEKETLQGNAYSKEAINKAETAQRLHDEAENGLRKQLELQAVTFIAKDEADLRFRTGDARIDELRKDIAILRESQSTLGGREYQAAQMRSQANWAKDHTTTIIFAVAAIAEAIILFLKK
jgi:hypothetical protein